MSNTVARSAATKIGADIRAKLIPDALAAVSSAWRVSDPMVNTVANSTAAGTTMNAESGSQ